MSGGYKINHQQGIYFLTFSIINWVDVFTRKSYKDLIVENLNHCVKTKNLKIYAWVIMSNHLHLIVSHENNLSGVIRDFKGYTSKLMIRSILENPESRRDWMLFQFRLRGKMNRRNQGYQFWTHENHPIELSTNEMIDQRINYIHENPVRAGFAIEAIYYPYSSAMDYADQKGLVEICKI